MPVLSSPDQIRRLLARSGTIAVVGLSADPSRASHDVAAYLRDQGFRVIGVNPNHSTVFGEAVYPTLSDIPAADLAAIDLVDVFRRPEHALEVVRESARLGLKAIWFQLGVATSEAVEEADRAGMEVVAESCIKTAHMVLRP